MWKITLDHIQTRLLLATPLLVHRNVLLYLWLTTKMTDFRHRKNWTTAGEGMQMNYSNRLRNSSPHLRNTTTYLLFLFRLGLHLSTEITTQTIHRTTPGTPFPIIRRNCTNSTHRT